MRAIITLLLLFTVAERTFGQQDICVDISIENFKTPDGKQNAVTETLTREVTDILSQMEGCSVVERRKVARLDQVREREKRELEINGPSSELQIHNVTKAERAVFGEVEQDISFNVFLYLNFVELSTKQTRTFSIYIEANQMISPTARIKLMEKALRRFILKDPSENFETNYYEPQTKKMDLSTAKLLLSEAVKNRDGAMQGQAEAIEYLLSNGFQYTHFDFEGVNLSGANISDGNFEGALFNTSQLTNIIASNSNLNSSQLRFADLTMGNFKKANLSKVYAPFALCKKSNFELANLSEANFFSSDLRYANFKGANLKGACFAFADLRGAIFDDADLTGAFLTGAIIDSATFKNTIIRKTDFLGTVTNELQLSEIQKDGVCRHPVDLREAYPGAPELLIYKIRLVNARKSNKFSSGYEYDDVINTMHRCGVFNNFDNTSLPVVTSNQYSPSRYDPRFPCSENIYVYDHYSSKANRLNVLKERIERHCALLQSKLTKDRTINGDNTQLKEWEIQIRNNVKNFQPSSNPYYDSDLLNVLLLKHGLIDDDWQYMASERLFIENTIRHDYSAKYLRFTMWTPFYPTEQEYLPFNELPQNHLSFFKEWTVKRTSYDFDNIIVKAPINGLYIRLNQDSLSVERIIHNIVFSDHYTYDHYRKPTFKDSLIDVSKLIEVPRNRVRAVKTAYFVFSENPDIYSFKLPDLLSYKEVKDSLYFDLELKLKNVERVENEKQSGEFLYLLHVQPIEIRLMNNDILEWKYRY